jgi:spermidine synthase
MSKGYIVNYAKVCPPKFYLYTYLLGSIMIPWTQLGTAQIPNNGGELKFSQRGDEFSIRLSGIRGELMNSRLYNSEKELAELGCAHLKSTDDAHVLVGGLGMGYTLAAALKSVYEKSLVTVAELIPEVVEWNQGPLGNCANNPLQDPRTKVHVGDVRELLNIRQPTFDAILLDVDNGPEGLTQKGNNSIYSLQGLDNIYHTLRPKGRLDLKLIHALCGRVRERAVGILSFWHVNPNLFCVDES